MRSSRTHPSDPAVIGARKAEHLIHAQGDAEATRSPGWADIDLVHQALPELNLDDVDLRTTFLGRELQAPLVIAGMTGGHPEAVTINARLARAAERCGLAMGVGSQRAALLAPELSYTYKVARAEAPGAFLIGNIGAAQLIQQGAEPGLSERDIRRAIEMIQADALAVHLNFLEEVVQPEGNHRARGCLAALGELASALADETPIIAKETGAGIGAGMAGKLAACGVAALDVGGRGGTSFAAIEASRATDRGQAPLATLGAVFRDWGIPTAVSVLGAANTGLPVIATGGIRSGLDAAKAIACGATLVGVARPLLKAAIDGEEPLMAAIQQLLLELRAAMFLTGSANSATLRTAKKVVHGETSSWIRQLGLAATDE